MDLNSIKEWFQGRLAAMQASPTQDGFRTMRASSLDDTINASPIGQVLTGASKVVQGALAPTDEYGNPNVDLGMTSLSKPITEIMRPTARAEKARRIAQRMEDYAQSVWRRSDDRARAAMDVEDILEGAPTTSINPEGYTWDNVINWRDQASQLSRRGVRARQRADQLFQLANETETIRTTNPVTFESSLRQTLAREGMPESYTPKMLQQLTNKLPGQGIKKEELKWLGWNDYVERRMREGKRVSRQELLDWVDQNTIDVIEHTSGKPPKWDDELGAIRQTSDGDFTPQYETHTLPGGDNYREVLLQWGNKNQRDASAKSFQDYLKANRYRQEPNGRYSWEGEGSFSYEDLYPDYQHWTKGEGGGESYQSGHFDPPNILAHTRLKDRVTPDGKKVLFVEEIQSDWHQAKRDAPKRDAWNRRVSEWKKANGLSNGRWTDLSPDIPDAPFADNWDELTLKRILKMASEGGYDAVGWTTGAHQQKRYNQAITNGVDEISWNPETHNLAMWKDGKIIKSELVRPENLPNTVGWDAADQILTNAVAKEKDIYDKPIFSSVRVKAQNMTIGKAGMETFYDKILPARAQALAKRHGGSYRQGQIQVGTREYTPLTFDEFVEQQGYTPRQEWVYDSAGDSHLEDVFDTPNGRRSWDDVITEFKKITLNAPKYDNVHMLDLPPQTRESIKAKAFPLFEAAPVLGLAELYRRNLNAVERKRSQE